MDPLRRDDRPTAQLVRKARGKVRKMILKEGGSVHDYHEAFSEGLLILGDNLGEGNFRGESSLETYLVSTCRFCFWAMKKKGYKYAAGVEIEDTPFEHKFPFVTKELRKLVAKLYELSSDGCEKILKLWSRGVQHQDIADRLHIPTSAASRQRVSHCIKKMKEILNRQPGLQKEIKNFFDGRS